MDLHRGTDFNDVSKILFHCLQGSNPGFNRFSYFDKFTLLKTNVERVNFVYKDVKKYPRDFVKFMKDTKNDDVALRHMENAKLKLNCANYWEALESNALCLATAQTDRFLALAYSNRAECFFKLNMPVQCLEAIERSLEHCNVKELEDKHREMGEEAKKTGSSLGNYFEPIPQRHFERNPFIQCANNSIKCEQDESRTLIVATRDIEIGEILAIEKPYTSVLVSDRQNHCHHCLHLCYNPIPCSTCTVALFCNESCRNKAAGYHKYECVVLLSICYRIICEFALDNTILLALKIALLAKDDYSELHAIRRHELNQCYQSDRYKEVHLLTHSEVVSTYELFHQAILTSLVVDLLWQHTSFFSGIFASSDTLDNFKEVMMTQLRNNSIAAVRIYEYTQKVDFCGTTNFGLGAYPFFSLLPHSCCANVMKTYHGNTMVLRALNTIHTGEQCFVNRYGLRYDVSNKQERVHFWEKNLLPSCTCRACRENWSADLSGSRRICERLDLDAMELGDLVTNVIGVDINKAEEFLPRLIELLKECESSEPMGDALALKNLIAHCYVILGNKNVQFDQSQRDVVLKP